MDEKNIPDAREWLAYAQSDLGVAKHLYEVYYPKPLEIICFHCQQSAEKAVKSIIVLGGSQGGLPKKHNIDLLLNQIKNMVIVEEKYYDYADTLEPYSVSMRYPNELFLEDHHAGKAIDIAQEFFDWAKEIIDSLERDSVKEN